MFCTKCCLLDFFLLTCVLSYFDFKKVCQLNVLYVSQLFQSDEMSKNRYSLLHFLHSLKTRLFNDTDFMGFLFKTFSFHIKFFIYVSPISSIQFNLPNNLLYLYPEHIH